MSKVNKVQCPMEGEQVKVMTSEELIAG